ncbi:hypothetical protein M378DRAFT_346452 [Amanita muscaria Koide BX008]|uniref:Uncharacterized protein n=1 Tax=Amanita muscaria (strain Koide BX008) TaxID=946122 RepID=A0A0C2SVC7_AMAMK|nr:hypothetical protein M378DRAFT_346452 [Amanita muscaria Koide BX008]
MYKAKEVLLSNNPRGSMPDIALPRHRFWGMRGKTRFTVHANQSINSGPRLSSPADAKSRQPVCTS